MLRDARTESARPWSLILGPWSLVLETRCQQPSFGLTFGDRCIHPLFEPLDLADQPLMLVVHALFERPHQRPHHPLRTSAQHALHADGGRPVRMDEFTRQSHRETRSAQSNRLGGLPRLTGGLRFPTGKTSRAPGVYPTPPRTLALRRQETACP